MRIHERECLLLGGHVREQLDQHEMLQDIGVVARVKTVAIAEHRNAPRQWPS
jgi:hypothetical protein